MCALRHRGPTPALAAAGLPLALGALVLAAGVASPARARRDDGCIECHATRAEERLRAPVVLEEDDVHGRAGLSCTRCHFGDPRATTARAHDLAGGFRGVPDAVGVTQVCGRCHDGSQEDVPAVLEAYRRGAHGTALALGHAGVATCTDCHGAHGIELATNAAAPTARANVVATCTRCHADEARMEEAGLRADVHRQWSQSVHGRAFAEGNEDAPTCASCHGAHQNGGGIDAAQACATCHEPIRQAFDRGPHGTEFTRLGFLDCAACHQSHAIRPADASLLAGLGAACGRCHGPGQEVFARVERLAAQAERIDAARAAWGAGDPRRAAVVEALHALDVEGLEAALEGAPEPVAEPETREAPPPSAPAHPPRAVPLARRAPILAAAAAIVLALLALLVHRRSRRGS